MERLGGAAEQQPLHCALSPAAFRLGGDIVIIRGTVSQGAEPGNGHPLSDSSNSYLPGRGDTMIKKVVHPGRGLAIALRLC